MRIIIQPEDGIDAVLSAIQRARSSIDIAVFRMDVKAILAALEAAVGRGVAVRAQVAHTNKGDEKGLRKLEVRLLDVGATVSRSPDVLLRYHGKLMVIDERTLHLYGFNFTWKDIGRSRSFGVVTSAPALVREALALLRADAGRHPYVEGCDRLLVSPVNARRRLAAFIAGARQQLLIYDEGVTDPRMLRLIADRVKAGVDVRIIGKAGRKAAIAAEPFPGKRMHVRAMVRDRSQAFLGSQSLRTLELDKRREVGLLISDRAVVKRMVETFEADWLLTKAGRAAADAEAASTHPLVIESTSLVLAARQAAAALTMTTQAAEIAVEAARAAADGSSDTAVQAARDAADEATQAARDAKAAAREAAREARDVEGEAERLALDAARQARAAAREAKSAAREARQAARDAEAAST